MCDSRIIRMTPPTLPSLLSILKDFAVRQYVKAACDTEGTSIILILCVCSFFEHSSSGPEHEINLRGTPYELGTYDRCDQRRLRRACVFAQSHQGLAHYQSLKWMKTLAK